MKLLAELRRRNVPRAAAAYVALGWLLIQVGDATLEAFGLGAGAQRVLIIVLAVGFVPAMVLAWVFEITPEGLRREEDPVYDEALRLRTRRALDRVIMVLLALALGYFAVDKFLLDPARDTARIQEATARAAKEAARATLRDARGARSIAVLPFDNLSSDPEQEYFSDGIAEEVLNLLAQIPELSVISRTSAFAFKGKDVGLGEIAQALDVVYVLEGSVRKAGERVRITTQLIDARTDTHLWSETYDRTLEDIFAVQDDVAAQVVAGLQLQLLGELPHAQRVDRQAHEHFLRARQLMSSWVADDVAAAVAELRQAIALAPEYAAAYALLADAMMVQGVASEGQLGSQAAATELVEKALALDPQLGEAWVMRGQLQDDLAAAETDMRRGLQLNPSYARGYEILAGLVSEFPGRGQEALDLIDQARTLDPMVPRNHHIKAALLAEFGEHAAAKSLWQQTLELDPRFRSALWGLGTISLYEGRLAEGVAYCERALAIDPEAAFIRSSLRGAYLILGDLDAANALNQPPDVVGSLEILIDQGDWAGAGDLLFGLEPDVRARLDDTLVGAVALRAALRSGHYERARDLVAAQLAFNGSVPEQVMYWDYAAYAALAQLMQAAGDEAAARKLLENLLAPMEAEQRRVPGVANIIDAQRAMVLALLGDTEGALGALERANYTLAWLGSLSHDEPSFVSLRAEPRFQALEARLRAHVARQRELLEQMRRNGEIPRRGRRGESEQKPSV